MPDTEASAEYNEKAIDLSGLYLRYENLLSELANCIAEYNELQHHLKVNVLDPALRQVKKTAKPDTRKHQEIQRYMKITKPV